MTTWATVLGPGRDGRGFRRRIVDSDFAWLVKACYHEAGSDNPFEWGAVLWVLANRWAGKYGVAGETLGQYAQRFCQPINPDQIGRVMPYDYTLGLKLDRSGNCVDQPVCCTVGIGTENCAQARAQARWARIRANRARPVSCYFSGGSGCSGIRAVPALADYVLRFMRGEIWDRRYLGLTDFAADYAGHGPDDVRVTLPGVTNAFYRETWTRGWTASTVKMIGSGGTTPLRAGLGLLGGILVGGIGLGLLVQYRRGAHSMRLRGPRRSM